MSILKRKVVLDTNILLDNPSILTRDDLDFVLPYVVLAELDKLKRNQELNYTARNAIKNILDGYKNGTVTIIGIPEELETNDEKIVQVAKDTGSYLWSRDVGAKVIAMSKGVELFDDDLKEYDKSYIGYRYLEVPQEWYYNFICKVNEAQYPEVEVPLEDLIKDNPINLNEYVIFKPDDGSLNSIIFRKNTEKFIHVSSSNKIFRTLSKDKRKVDIEFLSDEQVCAFDAVFNTDTSLCIIQGSVGCLVAGETLDVEVEPVWVTFGELDKFLKEEYNVNVPDYILTSKLKVLKKNGIITTKFKSDRCRHLLYDITEFPKSVAIYFTLNKRYTKFYLNTKNDFLTFRYWYNFYEYDLDKTLKTVDFLHIRKVRQHITLLDLNMYKDYKGYVKNVLSKLIVGEFPEGLTAKHQAFTKIHWVTRGYSEEEAIEKVRRIQLDNSIVRHSIEELKAINNKEKYPMYVDYWIARGCTLTEAKQHLIERGKTFTLDKCIKEYGQELGTAKWKDRQQRWQKTLASKSTEEYTSIQKSKDAKSLNYFIKKYGDLDEAYKKFNESVKRAGWGMKPPDSETDDIDGRLYYVHIWNKDIEVWKVGVTVKSIAKRLGSKEVFKAKYGLNYDILLDEKGKLYSDCYLKEQKILSDFKEFRVKTSYNGFRSSETFSKNVLGV